MLLRFWRLLGPPRTFYELSKNSFPYSPLLFPAFGQYGRSRSRPRYGSIDTLNTFFYIKKSKVVFAFIATHSPRSPLANDAIIELDRAYTLIETASKTNRRAAKALVRIVHSKTVN